MKKTLYDCVAVHGSQGLHGPQKAYACANCMEFFAELSVAYLYRLDDTVEYNKWYPFNYTQLRSYDPDTCKVLSDVWDIPYDIEEAKKEPVIYFNKISLVIIFLVIVGLFLFPLSSPSRFALHTLIMIFMYSVMAQSWNVLAGFSGQISLGHALFFGIGAYATSYFYSKFLLHFFM